MMNLHAHKLLFVTSAFVALLLSACKNNTTEPVIRKSTDAHTAKATTPSNSFTDLDLKYNLDKIKMMPGFKISVFAEVPNARSMTFGTKGTLFVGNLSGGKVYAVLDNDHNGVADKVYTIASGLNTPCGVAFKDGNLYVAEINRILRFDNIEANLEHPPAYKVIFDKLPSDKHHGWKFIAFGPDGKLYIPIGAPCNICEPAAPYASINRINADGTGFENYAKGVRNSVGFTWHPVTKELWFTDNGRDDLGDDVPNDELNRAPQKGMNFGYPYIHQGDIPDPVFGKGKNVKDFTPPMQKLGPHVASLGLRFYTGKLFPASYRNQLIIAEHGSWNRSQPIGYRLMLLKLKDNKPSEYVPFANGWLQENDKNKVLGRPVDVQVAPDGALLVSDDFRGAVYRIVPSK